MNKSKGFTIIELLVVVAIIAVLTGIVLVNVTSYINKGKDAAIKGNMSTMLINAAVYYDASATGFTGFAATSGYTGPQAAVTAAGGTGQATHENATNWCACSQEKTITTTSFCVDSTGSKKETPTSVCGTGTCSGAVGTSGAGSPTCQ